LELPILKVLAKRLLSEKRLLSKEGRKEERIENEGDRDEQRMKHRLHIIFTIKGLRKWGGIPYYDKTSSRILVQQDKTGFLGLGFVTFSELLKTAGLSRGPLAGHLKFLEGKGYLFSKNGVYRLNPEFEEDFVKISEETVAYLGSRILLTSYFARKKNIREFKTKNPREFNRFLRPDLLDEGYERYSDDIKRFANEEKRLRGIDL
jgi:hypothetical protein